LTHQSNCRSIYYRSKLFNIINKNLKKNEIYQYKNQTQKIGYTLKIPIKSSLKEPKKKQTPSSNSLCSTKFRSCHAVYLRFSILLGKQLFLVVPEYSSPKIGMNPLKIIINGYQILVKSKITNALKLSLI
jgi:hypothetical protein